MGGTSGSAARGLIGLWSVETETDKRKLLFLRRQVSASEHCTYHKMFMLPDIITVLEKYNMLNHMEGFLHLQIFWANLNGKGW